MQAFIFTKYHLRFCLLVLAVLFFVIPAQAKVHYKPIEKTYGCAKNAEISMPLPFSKSPHWDVTFHVQCYTSVGGGQAHFLSIKSKDKKTLFSMPVFGGFQKGAPISDSNEFKADHRLSYWENRGPGYIGIRFPSADESDAVYYGWVEVKVTQTKSGHWSWYIGGIACEDEAKKAIPAGVVPPNTKPLTASATFTTYPGTPFPFSTDHFSYTDGDGDPLDHIDIIAVNVPSGDLIFYDSSLVSCASCRQDLLPSQINNGNLLFSPGEPGSASFDFRVSDNRENSETATITMKTVPATWTGTGMVTDLSHWNGDILPAAETSVTIGNEGHMTLDKSRTVQNLFLMKNALVTVPDGITLTVKGDYRTIEGGKVATSGSGKVLIQGHFMDAENNPRTAGSATTVLENGGNVVAHPDHL